MILNVRLIILPRSWGRLIVDEQSNELLQQILSQQKEQTDLLRKNLGRIRFSLRALLLLMTFLCVALALFLGVFSKPQPIPVRPMVTKLTSPLPVSFPNNMPVL